MKKIYTLNTDDGASVGYGSKKAAVSNGEKSGMLFQVVSPSGQIVHDAASDVGESVAETETAPEVDPKIQDALDGSFVRDYPGNYAPQLAGIATSIADAFGGVRHETESVKGRLNKVVTFRGEEQHLAAFRNMLDQAIVDAKEGLHAWQKANIEKRRGLTDMQRFNQHREFLEKAGIGMAATVAEARS